MAYEGDMNKRALAAGGEVMRGVPLPLEDGGFIPGCGRGVPPDVSWPDYGGLQPPAAPPSPGLLR
jgi:hypothetical protein